MKNFLKWIFGPSKIEKERNNLLIQATNKLKDTTDPHKRLKLLRTIKSMRDEQ